MKKTILLLLLIITIPSSSFAKDTVVFLTPFVSKSKGDKKIEMSSLSLEMLRVHIINSQKIKIVEDPKVDYENKLISTSDAIKLGKIWKADFILTGSIAEVSGGNFILSIQLINIYSEKEVLGGNYRINKDLLKEDHERISNNIINIILEFTDVIIDDIKAYMGSEDWDNAIRYINIYRNKNSKLNKKKINKYYKKATFKLAQTRYEQSKKFITNYQFKKGRKALLVAIRLQPKNKKYKRYRFILEKKYKKYSDTIEVIMLKTVKSLIDDGEIKSANDILIRMENNGSKSKKFFKYMAHLRNEILADSGYKKSKNYYKKDNFSAARLEIKKAIRLKPKNSKYRKFEKKIITKEIVYKSNKAKMEKYYSFADDLSFFGLFMDQKSIHNYEGLGYLNTIYSHIDEENLFSDILRTEDSLNGIELSIFWHFPIPFVKLDNEYFNFYLTAIGTVGFSGLNNEEKSSLNGYTSLKTTTMFNSDLTLGGGPTVKFMSYTFGMGLILDLGMLNVSTNNKVLFSSTDETDESNLYSKAAFGYGVWISWMPSNNIHVYIYWRSYSANFDKDGVTIENNDFSNTTIGIGYKFF